MKSYSGVPSPSQAYGKRESQGLLKGAIVGFGKMAENGHLPGWQRTSKIQLTAVADPRPERRKWAQELIDGIRTYARIDDLLRTEDLDFVDICTPPPYHAPLIIQCLKQNLHVLCEKPFVSTMREYHRIRTLVEKGQKTAFPVHNWKHAPILAEAKDRILTGAIGHVLHCEFHTLRSKPAEGLSAWRDKADEAGGGGILMDHGWHAFYILLNLNQQRPVAVTAWMNPLLTSGAAERSVHLFLEFQSSTATMYLTWDASDRYNAARVYGTSGILCIEDDRLSLSTKGGHEEAIAFPSPLSNGSHHPDWFDGVTERFLYEIQHPEHCGKALDEVYTCLQLTLMAYASARRGSRRMAVAQE